MYSPNGGIAIRDVHVILHARYSIMVSLPDVCSVGTC